ncbi:MAG: transposase, partial [Deltaproteobacteria bacterium]|nr:transposase [Candidatus Tharpellaceae bacterium]
MHHKNIKLTVRKQLKKEFSNWKRLPKKMKREISNKVMVEVTADYDFNQEITAPVAELLGIENQLPTDGIIPLDEMAQYIDKVNSDRIIKLSSYDRSSIYIKDEELQFIDQLIDDNVINCLLSYDGYSPSMREILPSQLLKAELLKAIKYPEISYRKFCTDEYLGLDRKQNRVFVGFPLHKKTTIDHTQLCKFRTRLTFVQQINLLVYFLHYFYKSDLLGDCTLCGVDSTELANDCQIPLVAPANHHDSHFLPFLVKLAQAMGIDIQLVTADEAYHDKDGSLFNETRVIATTPPSSTVSIPDYVNTKTGEVFCHGECSTPMHHVGSDGQEHEFKCGAEPGECPYSENCLQYRFMPMDAGLFQRIPSATAGIEGAHDIRKNCERAFNLLKNQTGLENLRVRSQHATMSRCTFSTIAVLLIKMAG